MTQTVDDAGSAPAEEAAGAPDGGLGRLLPVRAGLAAAVVFVLGLLVGALTVGVLGGDPVVVRSETPADGGAASGPPLPAGDASARFVVSGECLSAVNAAQDTLLLVDDVGRGAAALDAAALDETVRRLMPLQTRLQSGLEACRGAVEVSGGGAGTEEPGAPSTPSGSPASPSGD